MFDDLSRQQKQKFWPHQVRAISFAIKHLNSNAGPCLIRMPTGTGKTGVIGAISMLSATGSTLVLTPWVSLRTQLVNDLKGDFWDKIGVRPKALEIKEMLPSNAKEVISQKSAIVVIATFQTLNDIRKRHPDIYKQLKKIFLSVIVDEGHYEPAVEWGKSVKGLDTKTLLLTATPYRNDLKLFRITEVNKSTHHYTHKDAAEQNIIRRLEIIDLTRPSKQNISSLASIFSSKWKALVKSKVLPSKDPRAIICCSSATEIEQAVVTLQSNGICAIGIHEQFKGRKEKCLYKDVPNRNEIDDAVWVHQYKLTEGLDDHRFCCLAIFSQIRSDRRLIQQIGRVLRTHSGDRKARPALIFSPGEFNISERWESYLLFETNLKLLEPQHFREVVDKLLTSQPEVEYFDGRFRKRFYPDRPQHHYQVIIPPSVHVLQITSDFKLSEYIEDCTDSLNTEDAVILGNDINSPCIVRDNLAFWIYASVKNSRYLNSTSLYEVRLESHCVVLAGNIALVSDTKGIYPKEYIGKNTKGIPTSLLPKFIDSDFRPTIVSVDSSIPYDTVVRGSDVRGYDLNRIPTSLTDRLHICRSVRGTSDTKGRRYVGISRGRLSENVSNDALLRFDVDEFSKWATGVANIINGSGLVNPLFERYMQISETPDKVVAKILSIDFLRDENCLTLANGEECHLMAQTYDVIDSGEKEKADYKIKINVKSGKEEKISTISMSYSRDRKKFLFRYLDGESLHVFWSSKSGQFSLPLNG